MSSLDTGASSDVEVEVGAEQSDEDYCDDLQQPEEEVTLDVCHRVRENALSPRRARRRLVRQRLIHRVGRTNPLGYRDI